MSKSQQGLEISVISVVDVSAHQGYTLSVKGYLEQLFILTS
jgi:hypothetical protein